LPNKFDKLILNSDNFIVRKDNGKSIVAGYHWFGDWGRDTLISLPGLTLITKRFEDAKQILLTLSKHCKNGLIPNVFSDKNSEASYNNVDGSLWFIDRVYQYLKYTFDIEFLEHIWDTLKSIIEAYKIGTDYEIRMDEDYLISHGPGLTWMDVKIGNHYPTPRSKKAVEIQALWYNALKIMSKMSNIIGDDDNYFIFSEKVKQNFCRNYDKQYDVLDLKDQSSRPNKIFLVSLDNTMIELNLQRNIIKDINEKLLTIFGLRTLSKNDNKYIGNYIGYHNKDEAYHNGTVWPWLMGPFITSYIKVNGNELITRKYAYDNFIFPMIEVFGKIWDGSIYEIFDGDPPFIPRGCINQAWSVAEILRSWIEDIEQVRPKFENRLESPKIGV
jgi:predicted glycogen debranching enzyme